MDVFDFFVQKAKKRLRTVVFPEGENPSIIKAAVRLRQEGLVQPVLLGDPEQVRETGRKLKVDLDGIGIYDPAADTRLEAYAADYSAVRMLPERVCRRIVSQPVYFAAMMVKAGEVDGMVAGISHPTGEVLMASELIIGLQPGISLPSSFYLMDVPGYLGSEDSLLIFADPAVNPDPDAEQLADIAVTTAQSARELLEWEPRIAFLSFSTKGSASHPCADKVIKAVELAHAKAPEVLLDGEMQADAALVEAVAKKKIEGESPVAGRANILIFPDLDAANIASKLVQQLAGARSYGPVLQGFKRPVSDLSRSATVQDIINTALLVAVRG